MKRRDFVAVSALSVGSFAVSKTFSAESPKTISVTQLPLWKGFNLLEKFTARQNRAYVEKDFEWIAGWKFNFVRLPMDYRCWTDPNDPKKLNEKVLHEIDQAVEWGKQHKIHVNLNLHRAPGYCVNPPKETLDLWESAEALEQFCFQWQQFAVRYKGISSEQVSFDLLNEPPNIPAEKYEKVVRAAVKAIREKDPDRLIFADGLRWGRRPVPSLADLKIVQSTRGYDPMRISHHKANWIENSNQWPEPTWPLKIDEEVWDKKRLFEENIKPWKEAESQGIGVHVGEWGSFNKTPYNVTLAWMEDCLSLWKEAGWGWALWNLRGSFGIVDSNRPGAQYEDFQGHSLDRKMLELLMK